MFTKLFWMDAFERAIATFAQVVLSIVTVFIPAAAISSKQELDVAVTVAMASLPLVLLAGLGGAALSLLKSLVAAKRAGTNTASLVVDSAPLN